HDAGIAQPGPVLGAAGHALRDDLAEDVGLGEALRADAQQLVARGRACRGEQQAEQDGLHGLAATRSAAPAPRNCSAASLAYRPFSRTSSSCVPVAMMRP